MSAFARLGLQYELDGRPLAIFGYLHIHNQGHDKNSIIRSPKTRGLLQKYYI